LTKALESACLEDALESSSARRSEGLVWIENHKDELRSIMDRINRTVSPNSGNRKRIS
jgi:hypothetical protein